MDHSSSYILAGSAQHDGASANSGAVYVFDPDTGVELRKLVASDEAFGDQFGRSVGLSGDIAAVGAWLRNDGFNNDGAVYLFDLTDGSEVDILQPNDKGQNFQFGVSLDIDGTTMIVGANRATGNATDSGAAYIFDLSTGNQLMKLFSSDGVRDDAFGLDVAISGNRAIVSAPFHDDPGAVYVFDVTTGQELRKLTIRGGNENDQFGISVELEGNIAVIGASGVDGVDEMGAPKLQSGAVYIYDISDGQLLHELKATDEAELDFFGRQVDIDGKLIAIGASEWNRGFTLGDTNVGTVYLFQLNFGIELKKIEEPDLTRDDQLGYGVSLANGLLLAGAIHEDGSGGALHANRGAIYAYEVDCPQPDARIGKSPFTGPGKGVYNTNSAGQSLRFVSRKLRKVSGWMSMENEGSVTENLRVSGRKSNRLFRVSYLGYPSGSPENITAQVVTGTYVEADVSNEEEGRRIRFSVNPSRKLKKTFRKRPGERRRKPVYKKRKFPIKLRAISENYPQIQDVTTARIETR